MADRAPAARDGGRTAGSGVTVHISALGNYADAAGELGTELHRFRAHDLRAARELHPGAFGRVGQDTGFTAAVIRFAGKATTGSGVLSASMAGLAATVRQTRNEYEATERANTDRLSNAGRPAPREAARV